MAVVPLLSYANEMKRSGAYYLEGMIINVTARSGSKGGTPGRRGGKQDSDHQRYDGKIQIKTKLGYEIREKSVVSFSGSVYVLKGKKTVKGFFKEAQPIRITGRDLTPRSFQLTLYLAYELKTPSGKVKYISEKLIVIASIRRGKLIIVEFENDSYVLESYPAKYKKIYSATLKLIEQAIDLLENEQKNFVGEKIKWATERLLKAAKLAGGFDPYLSQHLFDVVKNLRNADKTRDKERIHKLKNELDFMLSNF